MANTTRKQNIIVIVFAIAVVASSIFITLYAMGVLFGSPESKGDAYQHVTFTDAVITCQENTRRSYGEKIRNLVIDSHSSRFDQRQYLYKIFMKMDLLSSDRQDARLHYVNCFVRSSNGDIRKYEVFREEDDSKKGQRQSDDTNMFGMPKRKD